MSFPNKQKPCSFNGTIRASNLAANASATKTSLTDIIRVFKILNISNLNKYSALKFCIEEKLHFENV